LAGEGGVGRAMSFQTEWWFSLIEETHAFDRVTLEHGSSISICESRQFSRQYDRNATRSVPNVGNQSGLTVGRCLRKVKFC